MINILYRLFGTYTPNSYTVTERIWNEAEQDWDIFSNTVIPSGAAGVDWVWVSGVALFGLTLYAVLRMIGLIISKV